MLDVGRRRLGDLQTSRRQVAPRPARSPPHPHQKTPVASLRCPPPTRTRHDPTPCPHQPPLESSNQFQVHPPTLAPAPTPSGITTPPSPPPTPEGPASWTTPTGPPRPPPPAHAPPQPPPSRVASPLECGVHLDPVTVAYRTYGSLSQARDNAILVCHALTGRPVTWPSPTRSTGKPGWWDRLVGPGLAIDTSRFFIICANVLGGCMGTTGPATPRTTTRHPPLGHRLPPPSRSATWWPPRPHCSTPSPSPACSPWSAAPWAACRPWNGAATYPDRVRGCLPIATSAYHSPPRTSPSTRSSRQAIFADPDYRAGRYWEHDVIPARGLAVARMMAHITYLSEDALTRKFGRRLRRDPYNTAAPLSLFGDMFEVESYPPPPGQQLRPPLRRQLVPDHHPRHGLLRPRRRPRRSGRRRRRGRPRVGPSRATPVRFCVVSFSSDWLFPTSQSRALGPRAEPRRRQCQLRGDRERQGPRRLSARRTRARPRRPRLPVRCRPCRLARGIQGASPWAGPGPVRSTPSA